MVFKGLGVLRRCGHGGRGPAALGGRLTGGARGRSLGLGCLVEKRFALEGDGEAASSGAEGPGGGGGSGIGGGGAGTVDRVGPLGGSRPGGGRRREKRRGETTTGGRRRRRR